MMATPYKLSLSLANTLYSRVNEGAILNHEFEPPKWGYLVCVKEGPRFENTPDVMPTQVAKFIEKNLGKPPYYFSLRFFTVDRDEKTGKVFFDLCEQCATLEAAKEMAEYYNEYGIWDVVNKTEIVVKP
jgi:hypothetical protein